MTTATKSSSGKGASHAKHERGLLLVGLFKLSKAIFFGVVGFGALHMVHRDFGGFVQHITEALKLDADGHFVRFLLDKADLIDNHQLRKYSAFALMYSCVCIVEGVGLVLERTWAEYFTLILTIGAMPFEMYEIWRKPSYYSLGLLLANVVILVYLVWFLRRKGLLKVPVP